MRPICRRIDRDARCRFCRRGRSRFRGRGRGGCGCSGGPGLWGRCDGRENTRDTTACVAGAVDRGAVLVGKLHAPASTDDWRRCRSRSISGNTRDTTAGVTGAIIRGTVLIGELNPSTATHDGGCSCCENATNATTGIAGAELRCAESIRLLHTSTAAHNRRRCRSSSVGGDTRDTAAGISSTVLRRAVLIGKFNPPTATDDGSCGCCKNAGNP